MKLEFSKTVWIVNNTSKRLLIHLQVGKIHNDYRDEKKIAIIIENIGDSRDGIRNSKNNIKKYICQQENCTSK